MFFLRKVTRFNLVVTKLCQRIFKFEVQGYQLTTPILLFIKILNAKHCFDKEL